MRDTKAAVVRYLAGHRAVEARRRRLVEERGPSPTQAVAECLEVLAALERAGSWPGPRDPVQERGARRVRALWARVKREFQGGSRG